MVARLELIDRDLASRANQVQAHAEGFFQAKRDYELDLAKAFLAAEGSIPERRAKAEIALEDAASYRALREHEGAYEGAKRALSAVETRASVGQSVVRVMSKES